MRELWAALALQFAIDLVVAVVLIFGNSRHRPWKCPVCHGWGRRFYEVPLEANPAHKTAATCSACQGRGLIWERER